MYKEIFFTNVLRLLDERNWEQKELAVRTKVSAANLSDIVNGKGNPSLKTMEAIAIAFQVPLPMMLFPADIPLSHLIEHLTLSDVPEGCEFMAAIIPANKAQLVKIWEKEALQAQKAVECNSTVTEKQLEEI